MQGGQFDAKPFLLYYYYGGMIYLALKNYKRALFFFENVRMHDSTVATSYKLIVCWLVHKLFITISISQVIGCEDCL